MSGWFRAATPAVEEVEEEGKLDEGVKSKVFRIYVKSVRSLWVYVGVQEFTDANGISLQKASQLPVSSIRYPSSPIAASLLSHRSPLCRRLVLQTPPSTTRMKKS